LKTRCIPRPRVGIRVKDLNKSLEFYEGFLGLKIMNRHQVKKTKGEVVNLGNDYNDFIIELGSYAEDSQFNTEYVVGEALDHLSFAVGDLDSAIEEAKSNGYPVPLEIEEAGRRWAYIEDPNGIWIEFHS